MIDTTFSPAATPLAEKLLDRAREILARYPEGRERSALLPLLHLVQSEEGFVSPSGVTFCAEVLGITKAQVGAVATFYTMYKRRPTGDYLVSVCTNTMCNVLGGQEVYDTLTEHLGVGHDETTADGTITLEHAECLAACDYGPVMTVNYDFYDNITPDGAVGVVDQLKAGERPPPTRGARLCTLKEMSLQLAGFPDPRSEAIADGPPGPPTLRGVSLAQEHGITVADFDPETPIPRREGASGDKPAGPIKTAEAKAAGAAKKAAGAVKAAAATVADKVHGGKADDTADQPPRKAARKAPAPRDVKDGDAKDPQIRTAETRNPDAGTPAPNARGAKVPNGGPAPSTPDAQAAEAAGAAANPPAGDAKPAGDAGTGARQRNLEQAEENPK